MSMTVANSLLYYFNTLLTEFSWKSLLAFFVAVFTCISGGADQLVVSLFWLMVVDFGLGVVRAWHTHGFSGDKAKHGALKFALYGITVWVAVLVQDMITAMDPTVLGHKVGFAARDWMVAYLVLNEAVSCLEHLSAPPYNVKLPNGLLSRLKHYRGCVFGEKQGDDK